MEIHGKKILGQEIQPLSRQKRWIPPKITFNCQTFKINHLVHNPLLQLDKLQKVLTNFLLTLFSADTVDESSARTQAITAASIECQMKEPEKEHTTYESKAIQICKAIGNPQILTVFDKLKISQEIKLTPLEKQKYASVLSQVHTKVLSTKYEPK